MSEPKDHSDIDDVGCLAALEAFYAYLDGELKDQQEIANLEHHMAHCRNCFSRAEMERTLTSHIRRSAEHPAPEGLRARLRDLMDKF